MDPFDRTKCSFPVPDFRSERHERQWVWSLTPQQRMELLRLVQIARWGEERCNAPMDKSALVSMTMEEFCAMKEREDQEDEEWRKAHGWPSRYGKRTKL